MLSDGRQSPPSCCGVTTACTPSGGRHVAVLAVRLLRCGPVLLKRWRKLNVYSKGAGGGRTWGQEAEVGPKSS